MTDRDTLVDALHEQIDGDFLVAASRWTPGEDVAITKASVTEVVHWAADAVEPLLAAARAEGVREVRDAWQQGAWSDALDLRGLGLKSIATAQRVTDWLTARLSRIEAGDA